ncbi:MAG: RagB/SusD family nutrient uptake outer membrane protein [Prevotella sp.]|nr:RagB/SusD family nutrient uptake outer membrane protein [Prevotella sp.]
MIKELKDKTIMRRIRILIFAFFNVLIFSSCSDMLDTDSTRQLFDKELNSKTDSVFFGFGVMQAMQQLADQYVFQGEMQGDLVKTTFYTDNNLRQLANFSATTANKYDSAYVYYRVINNCNYYIAHRDTTLRTGSTNVVINEYAAIKAFRAWAYLQLARVYGKVPFFTEPLVTISQINNSNYPQLDIQGIVAQLAPDLEEYSGLPVPNYGVTSGNIGSTNWGQTKRMYPTLCFIPVDVILGEMYLEAGDYDKAARHYTTYLTDVAPDPDRRYAQSMTSGLRLRTRNDMDMLPSDYDGSVVAGISWSSVFNNNSVTDIISYIPMAVNSLRGVTTNVPLAFGYNYYSTSNAIDSLRVDEIQIAPSDAYTTLSDSSEYYYYKQVTGGLRQQYVNNAKLGDMRLRSTITQGEGEDSTKQWITKFNNGNIILYRTSTVYLHLAEAFNRLGYIDAAFAILKDGITASLLDSARTYITDDTRRLLQTTYPFLSDENISKFPVQTTNNYTSTNYGIHQHGAGVVGDGNYPGRSAYQLDSIVGLKMKEIANIYGVNVGTTKQDSINALEDILCDEYALEFAFEGNRYYDLCRMARHKNGTGTPYGDNFGSIWLARKLQYKNPQKSLLIPDNWYLPFQ